MTGFVGRPRVGTLGAASAEGGDDAGSPLPLIGSERRTPCPAGRWQEGGHHEATKGMRFVGVPLRGAPLLRAMTIREGRPHGVAPTVPAIFARWTPCQAESAVRQVGIDADPEDVKHVSLGAGSKTERWTPCPAGVHAHWAVKPDHRSGSPRPKSRSVNARLWNMGPGFRRGDIRRWHSGKMPGATEQKLRMGQRGS
jgi:hypothetical protein